MYRIIKQHQIWDFHSVYKYNILNEDNDIVSSFDIEITEEWNKLQSVYVYPEYRNNGLFNLIMATVQEDFDDLCLMVKKDYWLVDKYKKFGFEYLEEADEDYDWYYWSKN